MKLTVIKSLLVASLVAATAINAVEESSPATLAPTSSAIEGSSKDAFDLIPKASHTRASRYIARILSERHYLRPDLKYNNQLSEDVLNKYISILDSNRNYFYAEDIEGFQKFRYMIDDSIRSGHLKMAFDMYQVFQTRWQQRYDYAISLLNKPFDFNKDETFFYDREEQPWMVNQSEMDKLWHQRVKADALSLVLAEKEWPEVKDILIKRYQMAKRRISQNDSEDVFGSFMNSLTLTIEPHAAYFSPRGAENFDIEMRLSLEGIGAILQTDDVYTKINKLVTGAPAEKSKQIKVGDRIVGVGQGDEPIKDVVGWRLDDVVDLIRGEAGSQVRLQVLPKDEVVAGEYKTVELIRETVKLEELSAKSKIIEVELPNQKLKFGVISVPKFYVDWEKKYRQKAADYKSTSRDVAKFIRDFKEQGVEGVIIDLRNNGGGALDEAVELTGLFIDKGPVVQQKDFRGRVQILNDTDAGVAYDGPLAVLVNGNSASASEIFAGAIQDYGRGLIIGEQTFGKGTVQSVMNLNEFRGERDGPLGQLNLTTAKFYRISGETTQHRGVVPDIRFPSAFSHEEFGESSYENALEWDTIDSVKYSLLTDFDVVKSSLEQMHKLRIKRDNEFKYLMEDIDEYRQNKLNKSISLNLKVRKSKTEERKALRLDRVNQRLKEKGLETVKTLNDFDDSVFDDDDFRLQETGNILADYILLSSRKKLAEKK